MADKKVRMPATTAGITQYFEDYQSKLEIQPGHVIVLAIVVMLIVIFLELYGGAFIG
ncbi:preprotein translocase subunit Sec61beta [Candidatus Woesearchaeota archaeon]|nr:preprotein translocase subunit Sec61beta [Candidatus Woesearchaeota archaeon]